jgi:hypothetical protein
MSRDDWEHALVRAVVERAFRARLLADPADALAEYGLAAHEACLVESAQACSLGELAAHLLWLSSGARHGRDGYAILPGY